MPKSVSRTHLPRLTGEVLAGIEVTVSTPAIVKTPPRGVPARLTFWNCSPLTPAMP